MLRSIRKLSNDDFVLYVFLLIVLVISWILPKTGPLVMIDEFFDTAVVWFVVVILIKKIIKIPQLSQRPQKVWKIFTIFIGVVVIGWFALRYASDITCGTQSKSIKNVEVSKYQGRFGYISLHYYITGLDENGDKLRFEISADDYSRLSNRSCVTIVYYKHTKRVVNVN